MWANNTRKFRRSGPTYGTYGHGQIIDMRFLRFPALIGSIISCFRRIFTLPCIWWVRGCCLTLSDMIATVVLSASQKLTESTSLLRLSLMAYGTCSNLVPWAFAFPARTVHPFCIPYAIHDAHHSNFRIVRPGSNIPVHARTALEMLSLPKYSTCSKIPVCLFP